MHDYNDLKKHKIQKKILRLKDTLKTPEKYWRLPLALLT
jgi:hypothetical protein